MRQPVIPEILTWLGIDDYTWDMQIVNVMLYGTPVGPWDERRLKKFVGLKGWISTPRTEDWLFQ